jgi:hypothetical protein
MSSVADLDQKIEVVVIQNWPAWYAAYTVTEQSGAELPA